MRPQQSLYIKSGYQALLFLILSAKLNIYWCQLSYGTTRTIFPEYMSDENLVSYQVYENIATFKNIQQNSNVRFVYITTPV